MHATGRSHRRQQVLHGIVEANRCDVTHVTERKGRPFRLVCTNTTASYEKACKAFERDKRSLLAETVASDAGTLPDDLRKSRHVRFPATPTPT